MKYTKQYILITLLCICQSVLYASEELLNSARNFAEASKALAVVIEEKHEHTDGFNSFIDIGIDSEKLATALGGAVSGLPSASPAVFKSTRAMPSRHESAERFGERQLLIGNSKGRHDDSHNQGDTNRGGANRDNTGCLLAACACACSVQ